MKSISIKIFEYYYKKYLKQLIDKDFKPNNYIFFERTEDVFKWANKYYEYALCIKEEHNQSYFNDNKTFLPYITIEYYAGYFHEKINDYLRDSLSDFYKSLIFEEIVSRTEVLKKEIRKFQLDTNVVVVRRISNDFFKEVYLKKGKLKNNLIIQDLGFLSTSLDLYYRKNHQSDYSPLKNETILIIKVPKGVNALYIEPISNREEFELLLDCGVKMKIEQKISILGNKIVLAQVV